MKKLGFPDDSAVKNLPAMLETKETVSIPELGESPRRGNANPLWYSCLENPTARGV